MSELGNEPDSKQKAVLERHASWIELFFDLVVVAGIGQLAHLLHGSPSWSDVALYALLYLAFWTAWATFTMYGNVAGDRVRIPSMLIAMFGLAVMMAAVAGIHDNHALAFAVAYVAVRLLASRVWHNGQIVVDWPIAQMSLGVIPWIVSFWFEGETRFWLWTAGVTIDLLIMFVVSGSAIMEDAQEKLDRIIKVRGFKDDRMPELEALHSDRAHLAERLGLYVIIVLGEGCDPRDFCGLEAHLGLDGGQPRSRIVCPALGHVGSLASLRPRRCSAPAGREVSRSHRHGAALFHHRRYRGSGRRARSGNRTRCGAHAREPAVVVVRKHRSLFRNQPGGRAVRAIGPTVAARLGAPLHRRPHRHGHCRHAHERHVDHLGAGGHRDLAERLRVRAGAAFAPPLLCAFINPPRLIKAHSRGGFHPHRRVEAIGLSQQDSGQSLTQPRHLGPDGHRLARIAEQL